jgi:hypothetical protein
LGNIITTCGVILDFAILTRNYKCVVITVLFQLMHIYNGKGKAIPLQAWTGPEGYRSLRLPDFMIIGTRRW